MRILSLIIVFIFTLSQAQDIQLPQDLASKLPDALKYKLAQYIDEETAEAIKKANENDELGNKSGFVLGVSLGLKSFDAQQIISGFQELSSRTPSLNGGIVLGYQYFFNKYVGIRLTGTANVGTQARIKAQTLTPAYLAGQVPYDKTREVDLYQSYLPIQAGADLVFLASVYEKGKHAFGLSAGFGYEADWYVVQKASSQSTFDALTNLFQKPNSLITQGIYPEFGIFYFYGSHQFEIAYRFAEFSFMGNEGKDWNFDLGNDQMSNANTKFLKTSSLVLSYLYRF
ncbi:hypothetical protein [Helicobacter brantae]|uniref:Outer membrane protein beta-barrel domain-containing protein n=1 Tax=Helicobacter brantae TaxID=375927 RepID=A0A3D8IWR9_9HELI|nr:hypothetical protein [Helicobacter brantae]RDU69727.1 hypothetical protein CQA58_06685 [Helicobacter brantae]